MFSRNGLPVLALTKFASRSYGMSSLPSAKWWYSSRSAAVHPLSLQLTAAREPESGDVGEDVFDEHPTSINDPARNHKRFWCIGQL
jgi:hypothetical protein